MIDYNVHLKNGNVWRVDVELPMQDAPEDVPVCLSVSVDVIAPNRDLAQYLVATMYPDYQSICVPDESLT